MNVNIPVNQLNIDINKLREDDLNYGYLNSIWVDACKTFEETGRYTEVNFGSFIVSLSASKCRRNITLWNEQNAVETETVSYEPFVGYRQIVWEYLIYTAKLVTKNEPILT
jgi:hypothetical protein